MCVTPPKSASDRSVQPSNSLSCLSRSPPCPSSSSPSSSASSFSTSVETSSDVRFYLTVYSCIAVANTIFTAIRAFLFAYGTICAARAIHNRLLKRVLKVRHVITLKSSPVRRVGRENRT